MRVKLLPSSVSCGKGFFCGSMENRNFSGEADVCLLSMASASKSTGEQGRDFIIGWVAPIGVELDCEGEADSPMKRVRSFFGGDAFHHTIKVVEAIKNLTPSEDVLRDFDSIDYHSKTRARQQAGNLLRSSTELDSVLSHHCVFEISENRKANADKLRVTQIRSLKHPDEARLLREVYGDSFFLIGVHESFQDRKERLKAKCKSEDNAQDLITHDAFESDDSGQNTRDLFELCDAFISKTQQENGSLTWKNDLERILRLCTSHFNEVPRHDEFGMQVAYNASFRSGDLSRQVGAALFDKKGRMIAVGRNDAPMPGGGLYQVGQSHDVSDYALKYDPGQRFRQGLVDEAAKRVVETLKGIHEIIEAKIDVEVVCSAQIQSALAASPVKDIIEFGRSVHAEMDAIISAASKGFSVAESTLYTTTFPCHTCARHIIAAGIDRVVYVQPYPKSHALKLHGDALKSEYLDIPPQKDIDDNILRGLENKVDIVPLIGIAPRRYDSLFAMWTQTGIRHERKDGERALTRDSSTPHQFRFPFDTKAVLQLEAPVLEKYSEVFPKGNTGNRP